MSGRQISFDGWRLDTESGDLTRAGSRSRLQEQPLKLLELLIAEPGRVVTREQLITHLWPEGVVDFDTGLNAAVRKLRVALGDVADTPRYIETLPRRGYRFIGTVDAPPDSPMVSVQVEERIQNASGAAADAAEDRADTTRRRRTGVLAAATIAALILSAAGLLYGLLHRGKAPIPATVVTVAAPSPPALPGHTVAVLPFENLSAEPNNEFLALGIAEMVMHRLAGEKELTVIARTSSFVFRNRNEDAREIGRKLNARYLVAGSVQRAGERLRVTAELVDAVSGAHLWSLSFDRRLDDIFALQDEISGKVTDALSVSLSADAGRSAGERTAKLDAYLAYLQGRALISTFKIADAQAAVERFTRANQIDPGFAAAYAQKARAITQLVSLQDRPDPAARALAATLNDTALKIDPSLGEAWVQRAAARDTHDKSELLAAEREFRKGLALAPNYGQGFAQFAEFLYDQNRTDEASVMIDRARQVDPLAPRNHYLKGLILWNEDDAAQAESLFLQALRVNPTFHPALARLAMLRKSRGQYAEAAQLIERAIAIDPEAAWLREIAAMIYLDLGDPLSARAVLATPATQDSGIQICVSLYLGDTRHGAQAAYKLLTEEFPARMPQAAQRCAGVVVRNDALATHEYERAARVLEARYAVQTVELEDQAWSAEVWGLPYAQVLQAKGERARATQLLRSALAVMERERAQTSLDAEESYFRALALVLLDDPDGAIAALDAAAPDSWRWGRWFIEREPAFAGLQNDPRFQAIVAQLRARSQTQAALVAQMRKAGEIPDRATQHAR